MDHCRKHVAKYAMPYDIEFKDEMPKTLVGKVAYRVLEEEELAKNIIKKINTNTEQTFVSNLEVDKTKLHLIKEFYEQEEKERAWTEINIIIKNVIILFISKLLYI